MTIPDSSHPIWRKLATGAITYKFGLFAANMAIHRAVRDSAQNPEKTAALAEELHQFFARYAGLTADDLQKIVS